MVEKTNLQWWQSEGGDEIRGIEGSVKPFIRILKLPFLCPGDLKFPKIINYKSMDLILRVLSFKEALFDAKITTL